MSFVSIAACNIAYRFLLCLQLGHSKPIVFRRNETSPRAAMTVIVLQADPS